MSPLTEALPRPPVTTHDGQNICDLHKDEYANFHDLIEHFYYLGSQCDLIYDICKSNVRWWEIFHNSTGDDLEDMLEILIAHYYNFKKLIKPVEQVEELIKIYFTLYKKLENGNYHTLNRYLDEYYFITTGKERSELPQEEVDSSDDDDSDDDDTSSVPSDFSEYR